MNNVSALDRELNYDLLFETLLEKTKEGKLQWEETAEEGTFIAAAKGHQTFELRSEVESPSESGMTIAVAVTVPVVTIKDSHGNVEYRSPRKYFSAANELYSLATRIARRVDEKLEKSLQLLSQL